MPTKRLPDTDLELDAPGRAILGKHFRRQLLMD